MDNPQEITPEEANPEKINAPIADLLPLSRVLQAEFKEVHNKSAELDKELKQLETKRKNLQEDLQREEAEFNEIYNKPADSDKKPKQSEAKPKDSQDETQSEAAESAETHNKSAKDELAKRLEQLEAKRKRLQDFIQCEENERLKIIFKAVHEEKQSALCLSGGGIRSATFCLGIIQGLARHNVLHRFDYLSTVSGGGYIGGWLTAWIKRTAQEQQAQTKTNAKTACRKAAETVFDKLENNIKNNPDKLNTAPEPNEICHLRSYSNLLTPKIGLLSIDTWTLAAIYIRNLVLNWLVLVPLILAVLLIPRIYTAFAKGNIGDIPFVTKNWAIQILNGVVPLMNSVISFRNQYFDVQLEQYLTSDPSRVLSDLSLILGLIFGAMALAYISSHRPSIRDDGNVPLQNSEYAGIFGVFQTVQQSFIKENQFKRVKSVTKYFSEETNKFKLYFAIPFFLSVVFLTIGRAWKIKNEFYFNGYPSLDNPYLDWWEFGFGGTGLLVLGWVFTFFAVLLFFGWKPFKTFAFKNKIKRVIELLVVSVSGFVGGLLLWLLSLSGRISTILTCEPTAAMGPPDQTLCRNIDYSALFAWLDAPLLMLVFLFMGILSNGIGSKGIDDDDREWWARAAAYILLAIVIWTAVNALVIWVPNNLIKDYASLNIPLGLIGSIAGFVTILFGVSSKTPANDRQAEKVGRLTTILDYGIKLSAPVFTGFLIVFLSFFTDFLIMLIKYLPDPKTPSDQWKFPFDVWKDFHNDHYQKLISDIHTDTSVMFLVYMFGAFIIISAAMAWVININQFSLHSLYRNRLIRTYLGASNRRNPNSFTDFDQTDDVCMSELKSGNKVIKPFHIVNMTWNLVKGKKLAWQNRMATTFTVSPLHSGNFQTGYRPSDEYGGGGTGTAANKSKPISLGTALTISGAAASPNMGYYSSTFVTFLMTLFNARLGWWLGNPRHDKTYKKTGPSWALLPLISEALGLTEEDKDYIYLSDGGHFENLGLYEMVLRRCHYIFVVDASRDPDQKFENLGNAIRRIRVDLGINIEIKDYPKKQADPSPYCAIGEIRYKDMDEKGENGILIYIKPSLIGQEPTDIFNYAQDNLNFPHDPTSDLWFSEQQFESYRALGFYAIDQIFKKPLEGPGFSNLKQIIDDYLNPPSPTNIVEDLNNLNNLFYRDKKTGDK